ncbi:MAG: hypothetical protein ACNYPH_00585 [Gammaproteobacteria bacterium WSBS_2016_MAG_OTU1]
MPCPDVNAHGEGVQGYSDIVGPSGGEYRTFQCGFAYQQRIPLAQEAATGLLPWNTRSDSIPGVGFVYTWCRRCSR